MNIAEDNSGTDRQAWILVLASSAACIAGSSAIFGDVVYRWFVPKSTFQFSRSNKMLNLSLGLSSGVLLFTALYRLLPEGLVRFTDSDQLRERPKLANSLVFITFLGGALICSVLNFVIHVMTSKSIVHCAHDGEVEAQIREAGGLPPTSGHSDHTQHNHNSSATESSPLLHTGGSHEDSHKNDSVLDRTIKTLRGKNSIGKCLGYTELNKCEVDPLKLDEEVNMHSPVPGPLSISDEQISSSSTNIHADDEHDDNEHHHHHVLTRYSHLITIGIQTALAICVHKLPEGFLTFATTHADKRLGFSVFVALAIHNCVEGFTIAFPLYMALRNRWAALCVAALLGGCSQPLGALIAKLLFSRQFTEEQTALVFGVTVCTTAGFMAYVGFQMFAASLAFGAQQSTVVTCVFFGMAIMGATVCLSA